MVKLRQFQISDEIFNGYICDIDIEMAESKKDICGMVIDQMKDLFVFYKLEALIYILDSKSFHIHSDSFEEIKLGAEQDVFYVCGHCNDSELN
jgi:hypothetical protein